LRRAFDWMGTRLRPCSKSAVFNSDFCSDFHPRVAMITTLTHDHLSRYHGSFEEYTASKQRIFMKQSADDALIYSADSDALVAPSNALRRDFCL